MKAEYLKAECQCGWYCLVLKASNSDVYHCGRLLNKTAGSVKEAT